MLDTGARSAYAALTLVLFAQLSLQDLDSNINNLANDS